MLPWQQARELYIQQNITQTTQSHKTVFFIRTLILYSIFCLKLKRLKFKMLKSVGMTKLAYEAKHTKVKKVKYPEAM